MDMNANYHTHTVRCHHAIGNDEAYVTSAISAGFSILGFSDHSPWPFTDGHTSRIRMDAAELPDYVKSVRNLQKRYKDDIRIHLGLECEYFPEYFPWLDEQVARYRLEYLILGNHFQGSGNEGFYYGFCQNKTDLEAYVKSCVLGMESGRYLYLAHPDLMFHSYPLFDENAMAASRDLCRAMKREGFVMEYNLQGRLNHGKHMDSLGYPAPAFWRVAAEEGCKVIVGVDSHDPKTISSTTEMDRAKVFLSGLGMDVLDTIPIPSKEDA
jgi:histidinol-phosphatase (PHP family)